MRVDFGTVLGIEVCLPTRNASQCRGLTGCITWSGQGAREGSVAQEDVPGLAQLCRAGGRERREFAAAGYAGGHGKEGGRMAGGGRAGPDDDERVDPTAVTHTSSGEAEISGGVRLGGDDSPGFARLGDAKY
eukprot:3060026-Rhodomonas_salina.4